MIYRETGQFKTSYRLDQAIFLIAQDRWAIYAIMALAYVIIPLVANEYWLQAILIPFLVFAMAALGLNLLTGYAGQLSLGTGRLYGSRGVRGLQTHHRVSRCTDSPRVHPSGSRHRCGGDHLRTAELAHQRLVFGRGHIGCAIFLIWLFNRVGWFYNYNPSGTITDIRQGFAMLLLNSRFY